jgi:hypothetical protein
VYVPNPPGGNDSKRVCRAVPARLIRHAHSPSLPRAAPVIEGTNQQLSRFQAVSGCSEGQFFRADSVFSACEFISFHNYHNLVNMESPFRNTPSNHP